jgi:medium-chain acyl-[acyl-carrier-protein] hydrolase
MSPGTKAITCPHPKPGAALRLFCLPYAGGGASAYRLWGAELPSSIEVCPIQPPGREDRYSEPPFTSLTALARALARDMAPCLDRPFAIFGHSMGALLAFEIARVLRHAGLPEPRALLLAAYPAPRLSLARAPIHHLPDPEFIDEMRRLQGTPAAVLDNRELMAFVLPILRADFQACDTYAWSPELPLACPFVVYGGTEDREVSAPALEQWHEETAAAFDRRMFPGTHFFVQAHRELVLADIARRLAALTAQPARIMTAW